MRALNGAVIGGLPVASLGLLYGNRLLPAGMTERASAETWVFVGVWLLVAVWAVLRRNSGKIARDVLAAVAVLAVGLPLLNALATPQGSLLATLGRGDWEMAGIDLVLLASGALCGLLAWRRSQPQVEKVVRVRRRLVEESA
ncbi:hypothetical protein D9M71_601620 [compost metagenome]